MKRASRTPATFAAWVHFPSAFDIPIEGSRRCALSNRSPKKTQHDAYTRSRMDAFNIGRMAHPCLLYKTLRLIDERISNSSFSSSSSASGQG